MPDKQLIDEVELVMQSVITRTRSYLESEFGIGVGETNLGCGAMDSLTLLDMTAIIGMGERFNLLIVVSFQEELITALYQRMTEGFDVQPDEVDMYRESAAGEAVNTILGHCTMDLQHLDSRGILMTPPVVLHQVKTIRSMKNAMFYSQSLNTVFGRMNISLVGPAELFDARLDYAK